MINTNLLQNTVCQETNLEEDIVINCTSIITEIHFIVLLWSTQKNHIGQIRLPHFTTVFCLLSWCLLSAQRDSTPQNPFPSPSLSLTSSKASTRLYLCGTLQHMINNNLVSLSCALCKPINIIVAEALERFIEGEHHPPPPPSHLKYVPRLPVLPHNVYYRAAMAPL